MSKYHLLTTHTYSNIYETKSRPFYRLLLQRLSSQSIFFKSYYILKIPNKCIDYIFKNHSMFIKIIAFW